MKGWAIFRNSVRCLTDHLPAALRLSLLPFAAATFFELWVQTRWPGVSFGPGAGMPAGFAMAALVSMLLTLGVSIWIAIAWHRYLLMGEAARGWVPPLNRPVFGGYVARLMGIGLVAMAAVLVMGIVIAPFAVIFGAGVVQPASQVLGVFVATVLSLRFGLVLPAMASGENLDLGDAWRAGDGWMAEIAQLAVLTGGMSLVLSLAVILDGGANTITPIYTAVTGWISLMLSTTVLTLLYLHLIKGQPID